MGAFTNKAETAISSGLNLCILVVSTWDLVMSLAISQASPISLAFTTFAKSEKNFLQDHVSLCAL